VNVAILGGTGDFGRALAKRLSATGDGVVIGKRQDAIADDLAGLVLVRAAARPLGWGAVVVHAVALERGRHRPVLAVATVQRVEDEVVGVEEVLELHRGRRARRPRRDRDFPRSAC
jgi:predicted dinucleotide-binding enzyme